MQQFQILFSKILFPKLMPIGTKKFRQQKSSSVVLTKLMLTRMEKFPNRNSLMLAQILKKFQPCLPQFKINCKVDAKTTETIGAK